ncbi:MAG: Imm10 family immunity protein [Actinomycetota bacterium]|nr:Imm10 family immunity protein [Actinomycetota bacterium]MDQ5807248.1 Imm10 family immunity protein [Actinomycetota bacterium]
MVEFEAHAAADYVDEEAAARILIFAEKPDGAGLRLELQRALAPDEQDRAQGMDTYAVADADGAAHYGGIAEWSVDGQTVRIHFDEEAAAVFATDGYEIGIEAVDIAAPQIRAALETLTSE